MAGWARLSGLLLVLLLVGAACGGSDSDFQKVGDNLADGDGGAEYAVEQVATEEATESPIEEAPAAEATEAEVAAEPAVGADEAASGLAGGVDVPANLRPDDLGRDIIRTADITLEVPSVVAATQQALLVVSGQGGYLFDQQTQTQPEPVTVLTFKVLPEDFDTARSRLGELGTLRQERVSAEDVTDRIVDLRSRITTAEISVERLRGFLEAAPDLEAVARLEQQLLERETSLEELRGSLRSLEDRVALATIVVTLTQKPADVPDRAIELVRLPVAGDDHERCTELEGPRDERVITEVDPATEVTFCYLVTNDGEATLGGLELDDGGVGVRLRDLTAVEGDPEAPLAAGARLVLAVTTVIDGPVREPAVVSAVPVNANGDRTAKAVTAEHGTGVDVRSDDSLPGFGDALGGSWRTLGTLGSVALLVVAAVLPFLPLVALAAIGWAVWRRHQRRGVVPVEQEPVASAG